MNHNRAVRKTLKQILVPALDAAGFHGVFPEFRRTGGATLQLLSVQFDKHGGGFFLEFAEHALGDMSTSWGETIPESELTVAHTPIDCRARLQHKGGRNSVSEDWFRFDNLSEDQLLTLVRRVAGLLDQVDDWLRDGKTGANIFAYER